MNGASVSVSQAKTGVSPSLMKFIDNLVEPKVPRPTWEDLKNPQENIVASSRSRDIDALMQRLWIVNIGVSGSVKKIAVPWDCLSVSDEKQQKLKEDYISPPRKCIYPELECAYQRLVKLRQLMQKDLLKQVDRLWVVPESKISKFEARLKESRQEAQNCRMELHQNYLEHKRKYLVTTGEWLGAETTLSQEKIKKHIKDFEDKFPRENRIGRLDIKLQSFIHFPSLEEQASTNIEIAQYLLDREEIEAKRSLQKQFTSDLKCGVFDLAEGARVEFGEILSGILNDLKDWKITDKSKRLRDQLTERMNRLEVLVDLDFEDTLENLFHHVKSLQGLIGDVQSRSGTRLENKRLRERLDKVKAHLEAGRRLLPLD